jgi:hypothetical protein
MKKNNINWNKIGENIFNIFKSNSSLLFSGFTMIGLSLLCKKLNIPYQILTDPFTGINSTNNFTIRRGSDYISDMDTIYLMPNNAVEASMATIYKSLKPNDWESVKSDAASNIMDILSANSGNLSESTKIYAINILRGISDKANWNSTKNEINQYITEIGMGNY